MIRKFFVAALYLSLGVCLGALIVEIISIPIGPSPLGELWKKLN